ncbi:MAG: dephospho-CoA kinase [Bacteroidota bacterium]
MLKIGLTGNIGSGKSLVCHVFEKLNIPVFYADIEAKKILNNSIVISELINYFGDGILDKNRAAIDRKKMAAIVFNNKFKLKKLNSIIHPRLRIEFEDWCSTFKNSPYIIQEAAILLENGLGKNFDKIIVVSAPKKIRLLRAMERDSMAEAEVLARMKNQWSDKRKEMAADFVIKNDGKQLILPQILKIHQLFSSK